MQVLRPETQAEALRLLDEGDEDTKIIAGGTAVMLMLRNGLLYPSQLVAVDRVEGMDYVRVDGEVIRLGALASLRSLERSATVQQALPTFAAALPLVANHRVRQRATIGGNLSESDYASDPPAVLTTHDCWVRLTSSRGERLLRLPEFLVGYYETALEHGEMVTEVVIPRPPTSASTTYIKYVSRAAEDRPCVGVAAYLDVDRSGRCTELRVAVAGSTATPFVLPDVTDACRGTHPDSKTWAAVAEAYGNGINPIDDARGSAPYRKQVTENLVLRALVTIAGNGRNGASKL
jgi:carbon-monoxide dehydrogenase medium subunit